MSGEPTSPATISTSPATHISRKAILMKRKMQLRKSLAAKANVGGKVASMVQKLQKHHTGGEDGSDNSPKEEAVIFGAEEPPVHLSVSSAQSDFQPPPPPKSPLMPEQISAPTGTPSSPSIDSKSGQHLDSSTAKQEDIERNMRSSSSPKEQDDDDVVSEATSHMSLPTSQTTSTHSTYTSLSSLTSPNAVQAEDTEKLRSEKNDLHAKLQAYEADFVATHGREVETYQDLEPVAQSYRRYLTVKKEVAQRNKKGLSTKPTKRSRSPNRLDSSETASLSSPLDIITEARPEQEKTTEEGHDDRDLGGLRPHDDSDNSCVYQRDVAIDPRKKTAALSNKPTGQAMQKKKKKKSKRGGGDSETDAVVAAVAAILDNDKRHKVGDPGDVVLTDDSSSNASGPGRIVASSVAQPFDETSQEHEIMPHVQARRQQRGMGSNETTPERSNKAKGRNALAYNKGSPAGVASLTVEETPQRLGARPLLSADDDFPELEGPPPILSVVSSASSSGIMHLSEAGSPAPPVSFRSSSRTVPMASPWSACLADDASIPSAQFTTSIGSADEYDNDTYCTPAIVRIRQTATCSRNVPRSKQHRTITDVFTCKPRDEDIGSIDSEGPPAVCKSNVCKAPTPGSKANPYTSKPMPIDEANSFIVNITEKETVQREEEQMTDITFPSFPEVETWSHMVDDAMKALEEDVASAKETITSLPDQSQNSDPLSNAVSDKLKADASASNLTLVMEELDSLKAEFDGISKELTLSNDRLQQLEQDIAERDQTIATLQLERDLAQADVKHLEEKLGRLEKETKETSTSYRKKLKTKDAKIALLNNTIEKLKRELDTAKERATKSDNGIHHLPPTIVSSTGNHENNFIPNTITPKPLTSKTRSPSPLHPDDELDDDLHNNKSIDQPIQIELTELSLLSLPPKADQKSRAIDIIYRRNNRLASESPISMSSNGLELSESSSSLEEALAFVRSFSANQAMEDAIQNAENDNISAMEEKIYDTEAIANTGDNPKEESSDSIRLVAAPREELKQGEKEEGSKNGNECAELASEYCCVQEASEFIHNIHEDWRDERSD